MKVAKQGKLQWDINKELCERWKMSKNSLREAADITIRLFQGGANIVQFTDVVRASLEIQTENIPEVFVQAFSNQLEALTEEQWKIKQLVDESGEFRLVTLDGQGRDTFSGDNAAASFGLYESPAGEAGEVAQLKAAFGKLRSLGSRRFERIGSNGDTFGQVVSEIERKLLPSHQDA